MGMDVHGVAPKNDVGEYVRFNAWWWRPIPEYIKEKHPDLYDRCRDWPSTYDDDGDPIPMDLTDFIPDYRDGWQYNGGYGLDADDSCELSKRLKHDIASGDVAKYIEDRDRKIAAMPRKSCFSCGGSGIRADLVGRENGMPDRVVTGPEGNPRIGQKGWCNGCGGWGTRVPNETNYPLTLGSLSSFTDFLENCGGFQIW